ncbi:MAG TPA: adenylate/guanylate cyclase domain-containing protein [Agitococcus sp.]|uniref:CHASE2 domain-containing protein n=1 Tax=uncultured Agitococcus sp. TaxID=1506599 RepID=UPI00263425D8|nr:adenylate/guanylate cyclase domain-containing protein [uncultured Agitococcus sp.]HRH91253.1 adenylate/guanylate cyclase domain-containing protein [Agitococcus sp.]
MLEKLKIQLKHFPIWMGLVILSLFVVLELIAINKPHSVADNWLKRVDTLVYDWRFQGFMPKREETTKIVIIDVDERSLKQEGRWPWSREKLAKLVEALQRQQVKLIGFDVVFSEEERNAVQQVLAHSGLSDQAKQELQPLIPVLDGDKKFAQAITQKTVLGFFLHGAGGINSGVLPTPLLTVEPRDLDKVTINFMPDYTGNLAVFANAALGEGFITTLPDVDGVMRRSPLVLRYENGLYSSLSLELARIYLNQSSIQLQMVKSGGQLRLESINLGNHKIYTDESGMALIPYKGKGKSYTYISATDILNNPNNMPVLKDAIVLIGTSALGLTDLRTTPLQTGYPGVEIHANLLDAIIQSVGDQNHMYYRPDWEPGLTFLILLLSGLAFVFILPMLEPAYMLAVAGAWLTLLVIVNLVSWKVSHLDFPLAILVISTFSIAILNIGYGFLRTNNQKREMKMLFGQYVPPAHVEHMLENHHLAGLEGESRHMTVLFSDIRNFTTISEGLKATKLKQMLNEFFTPITGIIFQHNGTIDKYVGDMVMAFWNAPLLDANHAEHAIDAALSMLIKVEELKPIFVAKGLPEIDIGVGINTGFMNVGDMGSMYRRTYTVLGDSVNLGSRLESLTKFYGVKLLVGEGTYDVAPQFLYRLVDKIIVKGKREPVCVYEPVCRVEEASDSRKQRIEQYNQALAHYYSREWDAAEKILRQLHKADPERKLYKMYLERIDELRYEVLPDDWMGVFEHRSK